ncbi:MAG TPA: hypothetical protein ENF99_00465 [Candidatus Aenigmarchaeota archaeon]|nr:hypothetical protein [Candidatus Aenigmarchaeota archaeon]
MKKPKGYWVKVVWMSGAEEHCLNLPFLMKIVWYLGDKRTGEEEIYSEARIKQLMERGIPVIFSEHPCVTIPKFVRFMHKLRW